MNNKEDRKYGEHIRNFEQVWVDKKMHGEYKWMCENCGKTKPGWKMVCLYVSENWI